MSPQFDPFEGYKSLQDEFQDQLLGMMQIPDKAKKWTPEGSRDLTVKKEKKEKEATDKSKGMASMLGAAGAAFVVFGDAVQALLEPIELIADPFTQMAEIIAAELYPVLTPIADALYGAIPYVQQFAQMIGPVLTPIISAIVPMISQLCLQLLPVLVPLFQQLIPPISSIIMSLAGALIPAFVALLPAIVAITPLIVGIANIFAWLVDTLKGIPAAIVGIFSNIVVAVGQAATDWWNDLWDGK